MARFPAPLLLLLLLLPLSASADDLPPPVRAVLEQRCWDCHGEDTEESGLRLDSMTAALRGGDSGETTIQPGKPESSALWSRLTSDDPDQRMPPEGDPLGDSERAVLRDWIADADRWQDAQRRLRQESLDHWAFQPLASVELHRRDTSPIDELVQRRLEEAGLRPSPRASREVLIRRLTLVMHGLPPTPQEVSQFVEDRRPDAWARLVERVLASPRYGERWGAHWLDLVRFGETQGFETNRERPNAWPYRDWVIESLNDDKPYDQFVAAQLAGDALGDPVGTAFLVAGPNDIVKGQDPLLRLTQRQDELADMINTMGTAFLGLTLGCARCHNHKFDPVTHTDYYALQAVLAGVEHADRTLPPTTREAAELAELRGEIDELRGRLSQFVPGPSAAGDRPLREPVNAKGNIERLDGVRARFVRFTIERTNGSEPCIDELEIYSGDRNVALASLGAKSTSNGDFVHPLHKLEHINDGQYGNSRSWIASRREGGWVQIELPESIEIQRIQWARDREGKYGDRLPTAYRIEVAEAPGQWRTVASSADRQPLSAPSSDPIYDFESHDNGEQGRRWLQRLQQLQRRRRQLEGSRTIYAGQFKAAAVVRRLHRGDPTTPREAVAPNAVAALGTLAIDQQTPEAQRRLALARWITDPDNPLTPRVIVNRIWQFHFGEGIVDTPSDFGANGARPTHPSLLDHLARELIDNGWSLKHIHRAILLSDTWQQDSRPRADAVGIDADTRLLWRFPPRRLEAEAIRDSIVAVGGALDLRMGGPGFSGFEVQLENVRHYFPKQEYGPEDWRRMIYMTKVRQEKDAVFGAFDCPDASQVVPKRSRSTTPLQALSLLNSRFVNQQAELLARRLRTQAGQELADQVHLAYRLCFSRAAEPEELEEAEAMAAEHGLIQLCRALLNANEFVFIP